MNISGATASLFYDDGVTLVGGAAFAADDLHHARAIAPHVIAADGGADALDDFGIVPEAVIGDMDSMRGMVSKEARVLRVNEQNTTDFEKCLIHVNARFFIGVGFLGGRMDHTLSVLHGLMMHRGEVVVLIGEEDLVFAAPRAWSAELAAGDRVSFFPLMPCRGVASEGLRWPIKGLSFAAGSQIGTSNEATGGRVAASFDGPGVVTILPKAYLEAVIDSLVYRSKS